MDIETRLLRIEDLLSSILSRMDKPSTSLSSAKLAAEEEITIGRLQGKSVEQIIKQKRDMAIQSKGRKRC